MPDRSARFALVGALLLAATLAVAVPGAGAAHHPVDLDGVVSFEGAPLPGATVRVGILRDYDEGYGWYKVLDVVGEVVTGGDGNWALTVDGPGPWALDVVPPAGSAAARTWSGDCAATREYLSEWLFDGELDWTVLLFESAGCIDSVDVVSGGSASIDVAMVRGATVEGTVVGPWGDPVPGAWVSVRAMTWTSEGSTWHSRGWSTTTSADGTYTVQGITPDAQGYEVSFWAPPLRDESTAGWVALLKEPWLPMASGEVLVQSPVLEPEPCGAAPPFPDVADAPEGSFTSDGATCGEVAWLAGSGIATGYADGTFRPSGNVSRGAWITWLWRLAGSPTGFPDPGFSDVPPASLFHPAVAWAEATGVANGYPDGSYGAGRPVSVQAAVVMAWRQAGSPPPPYDIFAITDSIAGSAWELPAGHPFRSSLRWALAVALIDPEALEHDPYNPNGFKPVDQATRLLATSIIYDLAARLGS